ncbi:MAG: ester cyclase [Acidobacteria bacterium]|nr:ester cyclase [Acidobacteriota bacterium]
MTRDEVLDLIGRWQQTLDRRDPHAYAALYDDDARLDSPMAGSRIGKAGVTRVFDAFFSAFPDGVFTPEPPIVDMNTGRVVVVASAHGTHTGELMGLSPTGKTFRFPIVFLLDVRDGLIVRERRVYDFTGLLVQIGVLKAKPV